VKRVNIHDAKTNLSRRNQPVAELRLLRRKEVRKPRIGAAKVEFAEFVVPDSFFDPLPGDVLKAFSGK
jgi:hypothetical protein